MLRYISGYNRAMGLCRICSYLTGSGRGVIQDAALRRLYPNGPRPAFRRFRGELKGRVLEVGSGTGVLFEEYPPGLALIGIEPDVDFLPLAREAAIRASARVDPLRADAERMPFVDGVFDAVIVQLVLCSVQDPRRALAEILRVLKPGGLLYVYEHVASSGGPYRWFQHFTAPLVCWAAEGCHWNRDTGRLIRELPVQIESEERLALPVFPLPPIPVVNIVARKR
ncbi:MAG: methyltransferase [Phycisphaerae bacterium]